MNVATVLIPKYTPLPLGLTTIMSKEEDITVLPYLIEFFNKRFNVVKQLTSDSMLNI